jgi:hypothetical protein
MERGIDAAAKRKIIYSGREVIYGKQKKSPISLYWKLCEEPDGGGPAPASGR